MRMQLSTNTRFMNYDPMEDEQIKFMKRTIYLNSLKSTTLPNDPLSYILSSIVSTDDTDMTSVTVVNSSYVTGSIDSKNSLTDKQNIYVHHGIIHEPIDRIGPNSIVEFVDMNYASFIDNSVKKRITTTADYEFYDNNIVLPDPLHYDEIDQVRGTGCEASYFDIMMDQPMYDISKSFRTTFNTLIDKNTQVFRRNIYIENIKGFVDAINDYVPLFDSATFVTGFVCDILVNMDSFGFISADLVFGGSGKGYNVNKLIKSFDGPKDFYNQNASKFIKALASVNDSFPSSVGFVIYVSVVDPSNTQIMFVDTRLEKHTNNKTGVHRIENNNYIGIR